ncbi:MAG TPA: iron ABC transporter permease [Candidatus Bipolaricaulis sp.]|nr:iron ABC transporter permease [Candidatus Bipolaricaulis sp.]HRS13544.1 iron ABC transporter permease [Candidatus Bipolaricaulis sp.]HRU22026.1 iron ABC transporter permease [Candidatus Bipolaricaulis sp.]
MKRSALVGGLLLLPLPVMFFALMVGRYPISPGEVFAALTGGEVAEVVRALVLRIRLPRIGAAALVGANLAVAGAVYQGVFRNPLVEGRLLGVSSGAGLGAALAFLLFPQPAVVQAFAFAGGALGVALTALLGWTFGGGVLVLVIAGVLVDSFLSAVLGLVKYAADPLGTLPAITYWLLGGLSGVRVPDLLPLGIASGIGLSFFLLARWRLNLLTLADQEAEALGVRVRPTRFLVVGMGTLLVASAVSVSGTVSWVGLLVPHAARAVVGPDYARLLPAAAGLGAALVVALDTLARTLLTAEIPLGILTGLLGAPLFLVLFLRFLRERGGWR